MTAALLNVVTVSEAAKIYGVGERTIRYHVDAGNLTFRKAGTRILIDRASLENLHKRIYDLPLQGTSEMYVQTAVR